MSLELATNLYEDFTVHWEGLLLIESIHYHFLNEECETMLNGRLTYNQRQRSVMTAAANKQWAE